MKLLNAYFQDHQQAKYFRRFGLPLVILCVVSGCVQSPVVENSVQTYTMLDEIIKFAAQVLLIAIGSFLTVRFSLSGFYTQKWWEKKVETYEKIMVLLVDFSLFVGNDIDNFARNKNDIESVIGIGKSREEALEEIEKIISIGVFVISQEARDIIRELDNDLCTAIKSSESEFDWLIDESNLLHKAIGKFSDCAKQDLRISKSWIHRILG